MASWQKSVQTMHPLTQPPTYPPHLYLPLLPPGSTVDDQHQPTPPGPILPVDDWCWHNYSIRDVAKTPQVFFVNVNLCALVDPFGRSVGRFSYLGSGRFFFLGAVKNMKLGRLRLFVTVVK